MAAGKTAIVTGAGTGIGSAVALALLKAGYSVALDGSPRGAAGSDRRRWPSGKTLARAGRCRQARRRKALFAKTKKAFGRLDLLFNNAGIGAPPILLEDLTLRAVEGGGRHQPDRRLPLHAGGLPHHEGPEPARRAHHQ